MLPILPQLVQRKSSINRCSMFIDKLELAPRAPKALVKLRHFRFDHDFGAHGEISNILEGVDQSENQHQEAGQEVIFDS